MGANYKAPKKSPQNKGGEDGRAAEGGAVWGAVWGAGAGSGSVQPAVSNGGYVSQVIIPLRSEPSGSWGVSANELLLLR